MPSGLQVRELFDQDAGTWDRFVEASPQGTIFSESLWLGLLGPRYRIFGCYKGEELVGGCALFLDSSQPRATMGIPPLTPFQGILLRDYSGSRSTVRESTERQTSEALIQALHSDFDCITLANHYSYTDVRPFYWETFGQNDEYSVAIRYTHVVDLRDIDAAWSRLDKATRWEVQKAQSAGIEVSPSQDIECFDRIHCRTFERQGARRDIPGDLLPRVYQRLRTAQRCQLFLAHRRDGGVSSGVLIIWDSKRAYYLFGGSEPESRNDGSASLALWTAFQIMSQRVPEIDLVGCNSPQRGRFKAGFGGSLQHYFVVSLQRASATAEASRSAVTTV